MENEFNKYKSIQLLGIGALEVYLASKEDGLDQITSIRMLRSVFGLSLDEAKKICFKGDTGVEYNEQGGELVDEFAQILDDELGLD